MALTKTPLLAETVRKLVSRGASANAHRILSKLHAADVGQVLADLPEAYRLKTFQVVFRRDLALAAAALGELGVERAGTLLVRLEPEAVSQLLQELDPDDAAGFLSELPEELREQVLRGMRTREGLGCRGPAPISGGDRRAHHEPEGVLDRRGHHHR